MNKRGVKLALMLFVSLIIILLVTFVLVDWVWSVPKKICNGEVNACRTGVLAAYLQEKFFQEAHPPCHQTNYTFKKEKPEEINAVIAQELEKCVVKFNEGRFDVSITGGTSIFASDLVCFVCSEFEFREKAEEKYKEANIKGNNFKKYMAENKIHCSRPKVTYEEYFKNINNLTKEGKRYMTIQFMSKTQNEINPEENLVIVYAVAKEGMIGDLLNRYANLQIVQVGATIIAPVAKFISETAIWLGLFKRQKPPGIQFVFVAPPRGLHFEKCNFVFR